jgi:hypothetical protein
MDEDANDEVMTHQPHMEGSLVIITTEKLIDSTTQLAEYIDELGCVLVHMAKQMKNEWKVAMRTYG